MDNKLEKVLNQIGIDEDYMSYFSNCSIKNIVVDKKSNSFNFIISVDNILPKNVYDNVLACLKEEFNDRISVTISYEGEDYSNILEYIDYIIKCYAKDNVRYNVFVGRNINVGGRSIVFDVFNNVEEANLNDIKDDLVDRLRVYGFNVDVEINLDLSKENSLIEQIESEKIVDKIEFKEVEDKKEDVKPKNYYRAKKSREVTKIKDLLYEVENINIEVQVFGIDIFEAKSGYKIFTLKVTDFSDSMYCKIFTRDDEEYARLKALLKNGNWYSMYGRVKEDNFSNGELVFMTRLNDIISIDPKLDWVSVDNSERKRVELHAHTMMSQMDGVIDEVKLVNQAIKWGHRGIAITDHDGCQAFPHVYNEVVGHNKKILAPYKDKIKELEEKKNSIDKDNVCDINLIDEEISKVKDEMSKAPTFRVMYGTELEMSDDNLDIVISPNDSDINDATYVIFDTETTGFNPGLHDTMIEIGAVKMQHGVVLDTFNELINPGVLIDTEITELTGITNNMFKDCPKEEEVVRKFREWIGDLPLVAHNARFDINMLESAYYRYNLGELKNTV